MVLTCMLIIINLSVRCIKLISSTMAFVGMEGKSLHLYGHGNQTKLHALKIVIQTPPYRPFDHEDLLWEIGIQYTWM